MRLFATKTI